MGECLFCDFLLGGVGWRPLRRAKLWNFKLFDQTRVATLLSLSWITGAARSIACGTAGTRSGSVSPARPCSSSPQCDMKSAFCNGSEHIVSWITTRHGRFWKTSETGEEPRNRSGCSTNFETSLDREPKSHSDGSREAGGFRNMPR